MEATRYLYGNTDSLNVAVTCAYMKKRYPQYFQYEDEFGITRRIRMYGEVFDLPKEKVESLDNFVPKVESLFVLALNTIRDTFHMGEMMESIEQYPDLQLVQNLEFCIALRLELEFIGIHSESAFSATVLNDMLEPIYEDTDSVCYFLHPSMEKYVSCYPF